MGQLPSTVGTTLESGKLGRSIRLTNPTVSDARSSLEQGAEILASALVPHGFRFTLISCGSSSGGSFACGEFLRSDRRLELHFRHSLGLVTYHVGNLTLRHEDYMRALLGRSGASHYPGFSAEPLSAFEGLLQDLLDHCADFVNGTGEEFRKCIYRHRRYESLSPLQKMEFGAP